MKLFNTFLVLIFLCSCSSEKEEQPEVIYLWKGKVPNLEISKKVPDTIPSKGDNVLRLTNITNPNLLVYKPEKAKNNTIGIIVVPGGGYRILAYDKSGTEIAQWLTALGYTTFVLQYRVPDQHEGALQDIQRAMRIVKSQSEKYGIDANNIGLFGSSAGGNLSVRLSTRYSEKLYNPVDELDSLSAKPAFAALLYPAYLDHGDNNTITPEIKVTTNTIPMFMFASADDTHANSSLIMTSELRKNKVPVELHIFPTGGHGYGMRKGIEAAEFWPPIAEKWLERIHRK